MSYFCSMRSIIAFLTIFISVAIFAQEDTIPPYKTSINSLPNVLPIRHEIETDRPDFTESPNVVPKGALQIETGFVFEKDKQTGLNMGATPIHINSTTFNTGLLRYGLTDKLELRFNYSIDKVEESGGVSDTSYTELSPMFLGAKTNLYKGEKVSLGFLTHLYFTPDFDGLSPEFLMPISIDLSEKLGVAFQLGMSWGIGEESPVGLYSMSIGYAITDALNAYVEPYGYSINNLDYRGKDRRLNGGLTYLVNNKLQLDLTGGIGYTKHAPDHFINAGISYIFLNK